MAFLSEYLCIRQEMKSIEFKHILGAKNSDSNLGIKKKHSKKVKKNARLHNNSNNNNSTNNNNNVYKARTSDPILNDEDESQLSLLNGNNLESIELIQSNKNTLDSTMIDNALHSNEMEMEVKDSTQTILIQETNSKNKKSFDEKKSELNNNSGVLGSLTGLIGTASKSLSRLRNASNKEDYKNDDEIVPLTADNNDIKIV